MGQATHSIFLGFPDGSGSKESTCNAGDLGSIPGFDAWRRGWQPTLVYLPGEFPRTEEPGGLQSMGVAKCQIRLSTVERKEKNHNLK